jgi:hypothetical protein
VDESIDGRSRVIVAPATAHASIGFCMGRLMSEIAQDSVGGGFVRRLAHLWISGGGRRTFAAGFAVAWLNLGVLGALGPLVSRR